MDTIGRVNGSSAEPDAVFKLEKKWRGPASELAVMQEREGLVRRDFSCFAIWEGGRSKEGEIVEGIRRNFNVLGDYNIYWSERNYNRNIQRLYQRPSGSLDFKGYDKKIGKPPFRFIIVEDLEPQYALIRNVSGNIELSNRNVVKKKYEFRAWFDKAYQVHSSNNYEEFIFQTSLVLGSELLAECLSSDVPIKKDLQKDLEGANGWRDWNEPFEILNNCVKYLVLRNFENLPVRTGYGDVDFLCSDFQKLASAANVYQKNGRPYKGTIDIAGNTIPVDIRFVGDGYYPCSWEKDMLERRKKHGNFFVPELEDLFFSLLYHCKVHKSRVSESYVELLEEIAREKQWSWYQDVNVHDNVQMGGLLKGYFKSNNYYYEKPIDVGVNINKEVVRLLSESMFGERELGVFGKMAMKTVRLANKVLRKVKHQVKPSFNVIGKSIH
ncbi:hypothetical protein [Billgrantia antri]|uniref:hypothetical protein n=1 Tax=Billgrantia antri TaxID=2846777 RepID=UPI003B221B7E